MVGAKFFLLFFFAFCDAEVKPTESYPHSATLANGNMVLYWKIVEDKVEMELHGKTTGWIGIGLSNQGNMAGADIITGWVKDGVAHITDRHGVANTFPPKDSQQDVELISGKECNEWTVIKFRRPLAACQMDQDKSITRDTIRVIWAYGSADPTGEDLTPSDKHPATSRGSLSLILLDDMDFYRSNYEPRGETKSIIIANENVEVPPIPTHYHCIMVEIPEIAEKHHIIRARPVITKGNEMIVHHILLSQCAGTVENADDLMTKELSCFSPDMPAHFQTCNTMVAGFAIGGTDFYFPEEAGYPLGGEGDSRYFQLQIHYDNPLMRDDVIDSSGIELVYTSKLRRHDSGMVLLGNSINGLEHFIPPKAERFTTVGHCAPECLGGAMGFSGVSKIKVFGVLLHTHVRGRAIYVKHTRNGTEMPMIARDNYYDFNYQEIRFEKDLPEVLPSDYISVECAYDTKLDEKATMGGFGTQQEMCVAFLFYYPKIDLEYCASNPTSVESYPFFDISSYNVTGGVDLANVLVTSPEKYSGRTAMDIVNEVDWNEEKLKSFSDKLAQMTHVQKCEGQKFLPKQNQPFRQPEVRKPHVEKEQLCEKSWRVSSTAVEAAKCSACTAVSHPILFILCLVFEALSR